MHTFVKSVVNTIRKTDAFHVVHIRDINKDQYMDIIRNVVAKRTRPERILTAYAKADDHIFKEKAKRYPSIKKIKEYRTQFQAYQDLLEFMASYQLLSSIPNGPQSICKLCIDAPKEAI